MFKPSQTKMFMFRPSQMISIYDQTCDQNYLCVLHALKKPYVKTLVLSKLNTTSPLCNQNRNLCAPILNNLERFKTSMLKRLCVQKFLCVLRTFKKAYVQSFVCLSSFFFIKVMHNFYISFSIPVRKSGCILIWPPVFFYSSCQLYVVIKHVTI